MPSALSAANMNGWQKFGVRTWITNGRVWAVVGVTDVLREM